MAQYRPACKHLRLGEVFFDPVQAADFPKTILRYRNQEAAKSIGLDQLSDEDWIHHFGRFEPLPDNMPEPLALRYHGHQFRAYNHELGDGRGFLFAQAYDDQNRLLDLGTKGSGQTPWSRQGDGRLTLKGGVREVLATELLQALGVYTSKSFSLIETGEQLIRHDEPSPARSSVLVRLNHSHLRIGTFQSLLYHDQQSEIETLVHYAIAHYYPEAAQDPDPVIAFYRAVVKSVAQMGAEWFAAGFVHGVLNTDNITITGESFDYGPWRFLPTLDPEFTAAYFDQTGLYAFGRQPEALHWNLARLAECLLPLSNLDDLKAALSEFSPHFETFIEQQTLARLGLKQTNDQPDPIVAQFYQTLRDSDAHYEQSFFDLTLGADAERLRASSQANIYRSDLFKELLAQIRERERISGADEILSNDLFRPTRKAITLLIDEVEEIWDAIAKNDDWTLFDDKITHIRAYGDAQTDLFLQAIKRQN